MRRLAFLRESLCLCASMKFKPPFHEKVLEIALVITNESSTKDYWEAHNQLRTICETHENTILDHPFQWETLADFTKNNDERMSAYLKAIQLAKEQTQQEYIASIAKELAELYLEQNDISQALAYSKLSKNALTHFEDTELLKEVEDIEKRIFRIRT